jgi:hypothetical protein
MLIISLLSKYYKSNKITNDIRRTTRHCIPQNGRVVVEAVSCWLSTVAARVRDWIWQVRFVVGKMVLGQVFSEYFGFPCQNRSFHQLHHHHIHPGQLAEAL